MGLAGCAELNSIKRQSSLPPLGKDATAVEGQVITVDAKQRHLIAVPEIEVVDGAKVQTTWRMCAEAAPDVFSALASSGNFSIDISSTQAAKGGLSMAETVATIERMQTINMIRESFYRTCERYASGALTKESFIIQAARDQRSMVAILAIEQLTRAARPNPTIISGPATNAAIRDSETAVQMAEEFRKAADKAKAELAAAQSDFATKNDSGKCKDNETPPTGEGDDAEEARASHSACMIAKANVGVKEAENKVAQERLDAALKIVGEAATAISASTSAGVNSPGGGERTDPATMIAVANAVQTIALSPGINEPLMFCLAYLSYRQPSDLDKDVKGKCIEIIDKRSEEDIRILGQSNINEYLSISDISADSFEVFWNRISTDEKLDCKKFSSLRSSIDMPTFGNDDRLMRDFCRNSSKSDTKTHFNQLSFRWRKALGSK